MKLKSFAYTAVIIILLGVFEGGLRSMASVITKQQAVELNDDDDSPVKEKETEKPDHLTVKEYVPQFLSNKLLVPVFSVNTELARYTGNFRYQHHPEVLTPPPNA